MLVIKWNRIEAITWKVHDVCMPRYIINSTKIIIIIYYSRFSRVCSQIRLELQLSPVLLYRSILNSSDSWIKHSKSTILIDWEGELSWPWFVFKASSSSSSTFTKHCTVLWHWYTFCMCWLCKAERQAAAASSSQPARYRDEKKQWKTWSTGST